MKESISSQNSELKKKKLRMQLGEKGKMSKALQEMKIFFQILDEIGTIQILNQIK